ncbi:MAG: acyl-CoA dehydrogenase family protein [Myxococcales bacterium]|nr:MAG: acyl-CoA dehydrogenase family protein [Myxococcales bacterium]
MPNETHVERAPAQREHYTDESIVDLIVQQAKRFAQEHIDSAKIDTEKRIPSEILSGLAECGFFGVPIPEDYEGLGLGLRETCHVVAELACYDRSIATSVGLHCGLGTRGLIEFGSEELKRNWLPKLASGECIAAFCATEAGAGSDLSAIKTTARPVDNDEIEINGEKIYVTNAGFASLFTVLVKTPELGGRRSHALICIPASTPGITLGEEESKLGIRGSSTRTVTFDKVRVPRSNMLGETGAGMEQAHRVLEWGRTIMASGCIGIARAACKTSLEYVKTRQQFGRKLIEFEAVRHHLAAMFSKLYTMEAMVEQVGLCESRSENIATISSAAKIYCSESAFWIADQAIQLHGGMGCIEETGIALLLRDCRVTRIFEGANDVLLVHTGTALAASKTVSEQKQVHTTLPESLHGLSAVWQDSAESFNHTLQEKKKQFGVNIIRHQLVLQGLARIYVNLFAASASLARAKTSSDEPFAKHAARHLLLDANTHLLSLRHADDEASMNQSLVNAVEQNESFLKSFR